MPTSPFLLPFALALFLSCTPLLTHTEDRSTELLSLLHFKSLVTDPFDALSSWTATSPLSPCDWRGVTCLDSNNTNNNTVHSLRVPNLHLSGTISPLLANLHQLRVLSLHSNNLSSSVPGSIPDSCTYLRAVYLHNNSLSGTFPKAFFSLANLQTLSLANNRLSGGFTAPFSFQESLRFLDLSGNLFSGKIPDNFTVLHGLQVVNLSFNGFSGEIPTTIGNLQSLEYLWLDLNGIFGTVPAAVGNCSALVHFSAEGNLLRGLIPASIGNLPRLQVFSLSDNEISGPVPFNLLVGTLALRIVELGGNFLTRIVGPGDVAFSSSLEVLDLHRNRIDDVFPSFVTNVSTLRILDISGNFFRGYLPVGIGNLVNLEEFIVGNNSLSGGIPGEIRKCGSLKVLDLEGNIFSGLIPDVFVDLKKLTRFSVGGNRFRGTVPSSLATLLDLETLDLSNNGFTGALPDDIFGMSNLSVLNLGNNKFSGKILSKIGNLKGLRVLNMTGCGFSGEVPANISNLLRLTSLDLSKQNLSGEIPFELFGLPDLQVVSLEENKFSGVVPEGFSSLTSLQLLNLSSNAFSGKIPSIYGFLQSLTVLSLSDNLIVGSIPEELGNCSILEYLELRSNNLTGHISNLFTHLRHLQKLDLGRNRLSGTIPESISNSVSMTSLLLDWNQLSGPIPDTLLKLSNLTELNLSSNQLSGDIPSSLGLISSLTYLNLSRNNLEGEIPKILGSKFNDPSVFAMNKNLCGRPLRKNCKKKVNKRRLIILLAVAFAASLIVGLFCCGCLVACLYWHKKTRQGENGGKKRSPARISSESLGPMLVMFNNKITYAEAVEATRQFDEENVLSRGKYGLLFKATYFDGTVLSIRRLPDNSIDAATFKKEAENLGKIKHRNLTVLRGYFASADIRLLIYDYMPNGNLATLLQEASHQDGHILNWPMRHVIALGIARGLAFLHSFPIVHGDVNPKNILFDADFEAHLSEFGLEKLIVAGSSSTIVGTLGYIAPEVISSGQATIEGDVYSFGIVLMEILTGKKAVMFTQDEDIVKWVKRQLQSGQIAELLEPNLLELDPESSEWEEFLLGVKVGLLCTMPDPIERPLMGDIVFMLEGCRGGTENPLSEDSNIRPSPPT